MGGEQTPLRALCVGDLGARLAAPTRRRALAVLRLSNQSGPRRIEHRDTRWLRQALTSASARSVISIAVVVAARRPIGPLGGPTATGQPVAIGRGSSRRGFRHPLAARAPTWHLGTCGKYRAWRCESVPRTRDERHPLRRPPPDTTRTGVLLRPGGGARRSSTARGTHDGSGRGCCLRQPTQDCPDPLGRTSSPYSALAVHARTSGARAGFSPLCPESEHPAMS